jgi:hypothetical protein
MVDEGLLVVDGLEVVEAEVEQPDEVPTLAGVADGAPELVGELQAVRQAGDVIVEGLIGDVVDQSPLLQGGGCLGGHTGETV